LLSSREEIIDVLPGVSSASVMVRVRSAHSEDAVIPGLDSLWERMLSTENLGRALRRVRANRGAPGVDGMTTEELVPWLWEHWAAVRQALDAGTYRPSPARRVVIPKPGGAGERLLGVPTCLDRLIQQARLCCRVAAPTARILRWGLTGQKSAEVVVPVRERTSAGKDRTSSETEESVLLVPVAVIAAIPRNAGPLREETVSFR